MRNYRLPGMAIDGKLKADGTRYATNLTLREGAGTVKLKGVPAFQPMLKVIC